MPSNIGYATQDAKSPLGLFPFDRAAVGPEDVRIDIKFCGVCHFDVHQARDEFGGALATNFPCMPGHEIAGAVREVGASVTRHAVGDRVGVGCLVHWGAEDQRSVTEEQCQDPPAVVTYDTPDPDTNEVTFGSYSDEIVVHEHFALRIPDDLSLLDDDDAVAQAAGSLDVILSTIPTPFDTKDINDAFAAMVKEDAHFRYVIDNSTLLAAR